MNGEGGGTGSIRGGGHCFPGQGEDLLRKGEALEVVATEAAGGAAPVPGVVSREQQRHPEALVQRLDAADQVHRRADHGEVEAVGGADVAVHGVADMQRDAEAEGGLAGGLAPGGELPGRSEEHTSEIQSLMRISYAAFCLNTKQTSTN